MILCKPEDIFSLKVNPKEKIIILQEALENGDIPLNNLLEFYKTAKDPEKASCLSALAEITKTKPEFVKDQISFVISQLGHKANRINWEATEIIARVAGKYGQQVIEAIPKLQDNARNGGTVVKWAAAYAITEISRTDIQQAANLQPFIKNQSETETNNGVKKIYLQYLKGINNTKK